MITQRRKAKLQSLLKWQAKQDEEIKRKKQFDLWSSVIFFIAMVLVIWAIDIYLETFIDWRILVAPVMVGGVLGILVSWRKLFKHSYTVWAALVIGFGSGSALFYFGFLYANEKFADTTKTTEIFLIKGKGRLASRPCGEPYVIVDFYGLSKQIVFGCDDFSEVNSASKIKISYSKGLLGYNIIRSKSLEGA